MHQPDWSQSWQYPVPPPSLPWQPGSPVVLSGETKITMHQSEALGEAEEGGRVEQERTVMDHLLVATVVLLLVFVFLGRN